MSVYVIKPKDLDEPIYVGSTKRTIDERYKEHRWEYERYKNGKRRYVSVYNIFDEYGIHNCECVIIESNIDNSLLLQREAYHIKILNCVNKTSPFETQENKINKIKKTRQVYRENNRDKCLELSNHWRVQNRDRVNMRRRELRKLKKSNEIL